MANAKQDHLGSRGIRGDVHCCHLLPCSPRMNPGSSLGAMPESLAQMESVLRAGLSVVGPCDQWEAPSGHRREAAMRCHLTGHNRFWQTTLMYPKPVIQIHFFNLHSSQRSSTIPFKMFYIESLELRLVKLKRGLSGTALPRLIKSKL